jgi:hypothetical protein
MCKLATCENMKEDDTPLDNSEDVDEDEEETVD